MAILAGIGGDGGGSGRGGGGIQFGVQLSKKRRFGRLRNAFLRHRARAAARANKRANIQFGVGMGGSAKSEMGAEGDTAEIQLVTH